jgi:excisionase family DNA binding protein
METTNETVEVGVAEAAKRLGITTAYLYTLLWAARLEARKVDGKWRIPTEAIRERMARRMGNE